MISFLGYAALRLLSGVYGSSFFTEEDAKWKLPTFLYKCHRWQGLEEIWRTIMLDDSINAGTVHKTAKTLELRAKKEKRDSLSLLSGGPSCLTTPNLKALFHA